VTEFVPQRRETDCGVAAAAMLARVSYDEAMRALFPNATPRRKTFRTSYADIRRGIARAAGGATFGERRFLLFETWSQLEKQRGIIRIVWTRETTRHNSHWIVFDGTEVKGPPLLYDPTGAVLSKDDLPGEWRPVSFVVVRATARRSAATHKRSRPCTSRRT
jgi:ABC-type bacteriocin/lantibiotic exporter with double-glycine peptidase domain